MSLNQTQRQKKIAAALQRELARIFQSEMSRQGFFNIFLSITKVAVSVDFSNSKIYLSVFPKKNQDEIIDYIKGNSNRIRNQIAKKMRNQLRKVPEFSFFIDDSLDYIERVEDALKKSENPIIKNNLIKRKKK